MPTVDDLIVSLRIEETSNLGNLQKQLTSLVGKKGDKKLDLVGLGGVTKTDLNFIKNKLMELSPAVLSTEIAGLKESAKVSLRQLMKKNLQETLIGKYGIKKSELESWMIFLSKAITGQEVNTGKLANFIEKISDMIKGTARLGGPEKTRVTGVRGALQEKFIEEEFVRAMEDAGKFVRSQYQHYEIDPEKAIKYKGKIDEIIEGTKEKIKELHGIEFTPDMEKELIKLSKEVRDSDEFVEKALTKIGMELSDAEILIEKLKMGVEDPLLTILAFLRVKSAEDKIGMTIIENLNHAVKNILKKSVALTVRPADIKILRDDLQEIVDKAEDYGLKVTGDVDAIKDELETTIIEIKKTFDKGVADIDIQNDKRLKELGKTLLTYFVSASTPQGRRALKQWQETSEKGAKYIMIEGNFRDIERLLGAEQNVVELMADADVFKEYDANMDAMDEIKDNITSLIKQTIKEDPKNVREVLDKLFDLDKHITEIVEKEEEILNVVEGKVPEELTFRGVNAERNPFGESE